MLYDEFPHTITFLQNQRVSDGGGGHTTTWGPVLTIKVFMDTPSSRERYEAMQLNNPLDRYLYYPYRTDITADMRVEYEKGVYEIAGEPEDQGGQHEIMRVALKLVSDG
ncbi:phage head closure protein [Bacillus thermotolerans]|uniref:Phage head-tail adaptor n=1 Tax=Bacillus thermotolerans TaxID=1221996 RepID=A0A0F5HYX7_BACTR|nr:phage head closure protein [Bacillus thermotolerans]KKB34642.1 Phage head-tail adaptor [Bacillus thermotolerans]KKB38584.1 Phage head-tail adaptor [Bacillus thermotolerans]